MEKTNQEILDILYDHISGRSRYVLQGVENHSNEIIQALTQTTLTAITIAFGIILILGIVIIWNQRKIKKMLSELQEQMKQQSQTEP